MEILEAGVTSAGYLMMAIFFAFSFFGDLHKMAAPWDSLEKRTAEFAFCVDFMVFAVSATAAMIYGAL